MARRRNRNKLFESILDKVGATDLSSADKIKKSAQEKIRDEKSSIDIESEKYQYLFVISYVVDFFKMDRQSGYIENVRDDFKNGMDDLNDALESLLNQDDFKTSLILVKENNNYTKHTLELYDRLEIPIVNYQNEEIINWGNDRSRFDIDDGIKINLRIQFNLKDKSVHFYTKFMRRIIPPLTRMMIHTDKDLTHSEVQCYTFLRPEWANDPSVEYFCSLDELADELTISYRNEITFVQYFAGTYCAFNKIGNDLSDFVASEGGRT